MKFKINDAVMGVSSGDGWERIFKGKVIKTIPKDEDFPNQYVVYADEVVIVCDRYHPPLQEKGKILAYEESVNPYRELGFEAAKACMVVMQKWKDIVRYDWTQKRRDFFWKLYDLALYDLGLIHTSTQIRQFESDRLEEEKAKAIQAKV